MAGEDEVVSIVRVQYQGEEDLRRFAQGLEKATADSRTAGRAITAALNELSQGTISFVEAQHKITEALGVQDAALEKNKQMYRGEYYKTATSEANAHAKQLEVLNNVLSANSGALELNKTKQEQIANASARVLGAAERETAALREQAAAVQSLNEQTARLSPLRSKLNATGYNQGGRIPGTSPLGAYQNEFGSGTVAGRPSPIVDRDATLGKQSEERVAAERRILDLARQRMLADERAARHFQDSRDRLNALPPAPDSLYRPTVSLVDPARSARTTDQLAAAESRLTEQRRIALNESLNSLNSRFHGPFLPGTTSLPSASGGAGGSSTGGGGFIQGPLAPPPGSSGGGFRQGFGEGFIGQRGVAYSVGQASRFAVLYGSMYAALGLITKTFERALTESISFEKSLTELSVTTGKTRESQRDLADSLGRTATKYGESSASGVEAGATALGVFKVLDSGPGTQAATARAANETVQKLAFITGDKTRDLQENIAAIVQAFGGGAEQMKKISDNAIFFEKNFGIALGSTLKSIPAIASLAKEAGFSLTETYGIAAAVQSRQAGTPSASSGFLSQILSRQGEGTVQAQFQSLGIITGTFADKLKELADILPTLSPDTQQQVASSFGRGRSQSAAIAFLQELPRVKRLSEAADSGEAVGLTDKQASERFKDISGLLRTIGGDFNQFAKTLGESGLLDALGATVVVFDKLLVAITGVLDLWNQMPRAMKDVILGLTLLAIATKLGAASQIGGRFVTGLIGRGVAPGALIGEGAAGLRGGIAQVGARGTAASALGAVGLNPYVAGVAAAVITTGVIVNTLRKYSEATQKATDAMIVSASVNVSNADSLKATAEEARAAVKERQKKDGSFFTLGFGGVGAATQSGQLNQIAQLTEAQQRRVTEQAKNTANLSSFRDFSPPAVEEAFKQLNLSGSTALSVLKQYTQALDENGKVTAATLEKQFDPALLVGGIAAFTRSTLTKALSDSAAQVTVRSTRDGANYVNEHDVSSYLTPKLSELFEDALSMKSVRDAVKNLDIKSLNLSTGDQGSLADAALAPLFEGDALQKKLGISAQELEAVRRQIRKALIDKISTSFEGPRVNSLSGPDSLANIKQVVQQAQSARENVSQYDLGSLQDIAATEIDAITKQIKGTQVGDDIGSHLEELNKAEVNFAKAKVAALGRAFKLGQTDYKTPIDSLRTRIDEAVKGGDIDDLYALLKNADAATIALAKKKINAFYDLKESELSLEKQLNEVNDIIAGNVASGGISDEGNRGRAKDNLVTDVKNRADKKSGTYDQQRQAALAALDQAQVDSDTPAQINAARNAALSDRGDEVARSNVALTQAKANLEDYKTDQETAGKKDIAYWNLVGAVNDAKYQVAQAEKAQSETIKDLLGAQIGGPLAEALSAVRDADQAMKAAVTAAEKNAAQAEKYTADRGLRDALRNYRGNVRKLGLDLTNPLTVAREEARQAQEELAQNLKQFTSAGSAGGRSITREENDVLASNRLNVRDKQTNAESTAFSQRLTAAQTAENLGRISHAAYLRYLNSESDRLGAIKKRTFQQQSEYDEISGLLKSAADEMNSQFNLGDIKLPSVYQVRRYIKSQGDPASLTGASVGGNITNNTVTINGTNFTIEQLTSALSTVLGDGSVYSNIGH